MSANRLAEARSAYLRSAAHQPVHWRPWGPDAFAEARAAGRPVLLDIGAVWCHWCHVMDHESYEDPALADFLNAHFVCVKVDRDERPDVDARYQRAVQAIAGQGGWPLTAFLTPEGEVFFGGTYFPPDDRFGRPGFRRVLEQVLRFWRERRGAAEDRGRSLREVLAGGADRAAGGAVGPAALLAGERQTLAAYDSAFGGFGVQPKFPHPTALRFLMNRWSDHGSPEVRHAVVETLRAMARGGIRDHLGGGFHRYAVDRRWIVPHFEKMSYDNSELLRAYARAAALFDDPEFAAAARGIVRWVREVLALPEGGFGTSQDADVAPGDDGSYFTWTREEMAAVLDPEDLPLALRRFGVGTLGRMPEDPDRNVLFLAATPGELATEFGLAPGEVAARLERIAAALLAARGRRPAPAVDRTPYASWNALMASALLRAGPVLDDPGATRLALGALERMRGEAPAPDRVAHAPGSDLGLLEDQVFCADAALDAFEATGQAEWLAWAEGLMERTWREHRRAGHAGLLDRPAEAVGEGLLSTPLVSIEDAPVPSPNGVAGVVCARLAAHTGRGVWGERHRAQVEAFAGSAPRAGLHAGAWLLAADWLVRGPVIAAVAGAADDAGARALLAAARAAPLPRRVLRRVEPGTPPGGLPAALGAMLAGGAGPAGYLCLGDRCLAPARDPGEWAQRLAEGSRRAVPGAG